MPKKFQRQIEDFTCEYCQNFVTGDGYTNHCPNCLWSKHVDNHPGDRTVKCQGLMEPINVFYKNNIWHITHQCQKCGIEKNVKVSTNDNQSTLKKIIQNNLKK